jgi:hypothetical protein
MVAVIVALSRGGVGRVRELPMPINIRTCPGGTGESGSALQCWDDVPKTRTSLMVAPKLFSNLGAKDHFLALERERHFGATIRDDRYNSVLLSRCPIPGRLYRGEAYGVPSESRPAS